MTDSIRRLHEAVTATRDGMNSSPRTAKLFARGRGFIAKKVAEEAVEVALDGVCGDRAGAVRESADLIYNRIVLWADLGIEPEEVWSEMQRREQLLGMAEKLPKRRFAAEPDSGSAKSAAQSASKSALEFSGEGPGPGARRR
ncbi:phosphoribosyl-ATP diphosphatase [Ancylobacter mangrovi]|uniref:phosphoribosyl-ATP diphosphatase n=1 Tax=Ancylobacter mangrovi TaxID=2972472 RepID=UPI0021629212|nr:phosphoribosyl-ATP diphosphatase [Ancylobacter mangrovi]MCS0504944.1 phosphoribosyl-ATP diphosphatase [Ancylobacter mangrovi]